MCSGMAVKDRSWSQGQHRVELFVSFFMNYIKCKFDIVASLLNVIHVHVYSNIGSTNGIHKLFVESFFSGEKGGPLTSK